jgi:hypothetical protein
MERCANQIAGAFERFVEAIRILQIAKAKFAKSNVSSLLFCVFVICEKPFLDFAFFEFFILHLFVRGEQTCRRE